MDKKTQPTSEETKKMSVGQIYCYCGRILPGASEEVQKQITKNVMQNFDILTVSAIKIKKGLSRGHKYGISKEVQNHGKAKDALKGATQRSSSTIFERYQNDDQYRARINDQGLNEDDVLRRDEEAKIDRVRCANATEKQRCGTLMSWREIADLMLGIFAKTVNTLTMKKH